MASLFRDRTLGHSRRDSFSSSSTTTANAAAASPSCATSRFNSAAAMSSLPSSFGDLTATLSDSHLRSSAYEIFLSANRSSSSKPLTYISNSNHTNSPNNSSVNGNSTSAATMQRSLTSAAASKMKKALGMRSSSSKRSSDSNISGGGGKIKRPLTVGELMRMQMRVSEAAAGGFRWAAK